MISFCIVNRISDIVGMQKQFSIGEKKRFFRIDGLWTIHVKSRENYIPNTLSRYLLADLQLQVQ